MKLFNHLRTISFLAIAGLMITGCHSEIDLTNLDTTSEVSLNLVLPVGNIRISTGNFLKVDSIPDLYLETVDGVENVITLKRHFDFVKYFHDVDLSENISQGVFDLMMYDRINNLGLIAPDGYVYGAGVPITIDFPLTLNLSGINNEVSDERLDSALIETAQFLSKIGQRNLNDLKWAWVDSITMDLGKRVRRPKGNRITIYDKREMGSFVTDYNELLYNDIDDFTLVMMKDPYLTPAEWQEYRYNALDKCEFRIYLTLTIPMGQRVYVPTDAAFTYDLGVQFIDYTAIWGMYSPSKEMYDADTIDFADVWEGIPFLANASMPFTHPSISLDIFTKLAGAIEVTGDYLYTTDANGQPHYATFNGKRYFDKKFVDGEYLNPYTSAIGDSTTNMRLAFDNTEPNGKISNLFEKTPYSLGYKFGFKFNEQETPQMRLVPNTGVRMAGEVKMPMAFGEGLSIAYTDTAANMDISQFSIDSLLGDGGAVVLDSLKKTTNVNVLLTAENGIPFRLKLLLNFLDENDQIINDPSTGRPLSLFKNDTLTLEPPTFTKNSDNTWSSVPKQTVDTASLTREKLNLFPKAKRMLYSLYLDNESLKYAYDQGDFSVKLTTDQSVKIKLGLTAQIDAVLHFNTNNSNQ